MPPSQETVKEVLNLCMERIVKEAREDIIRVCGIERESIVDGPGFRYVLLSRAALTDVRAVIIRSLMTLRAEQT